MTITHVYRILHVSNIYRHYWLNYIYIYVVLKEILPCLERRITILSRHVADARKGVKNVLKSFWRKPREESPSRLGGNGTVRYRFDRIEMQILLLADTCFLIKVSESVCVCVCVWVNERGREWVREWVNMCVYVRVSESVCMCEWGEGGECVHRCVRACVCWSVGMSGILDLNISVRAYAYLIGLYLYLFVYVNVCLSQSASWLNIYDTFHLFLYTSPLP